MSDTTRTYDTVWLGQPALALETASLRLITIPGMGAKIVSLLDKSANREWLLPPTHRAFKPVAYGASFVEQDMSGWDEMFPTINACAYPADGRYRNAALPDHGEVWALAWQIETTSNDCITLSVEGRALPYHLTRTAQVLGNQHIRLEFVVVNTGTEPLAALWAAHPQFAVDTETRIKLPASVERVVKVYPPDKNSENQTLLWPETQMENGQLLRLDHIGDAKLHDCRKVYLPPDQPVAWAALQQGNEGNWLRLSWDTGRVPYLGIWVDEGTYNAASTAALEPATGYYDSLSLAWANKRVMHLPPQTPVSWYVDIEVGTGAIQSTAQ